MNSKQVIETWLEEIEDYEFLFYTDPDTGEKEYAGENIKQAAEVWGVSEVCVNDLITAFNFMRDEMISNIKKDLEDIWKRVG